MAATLGTLSVGQKVHLVARHRLGKEIPITATAKRIFDRIEPELSPKDWFAYDDDWTLQGVESDKAT